MLFFYFIQGLFLGFSVLSSCEAVDLFVNIIIIMLKKEKVDAEVFDVDEKSE